MQASLFWLRLPVHVSDSQDFRAGVSGQSYAVTAKNVHTKNICKHQINRWLRGGAPSPNPERIAPIRLTPSVLVHHLIWKARSSIKKSLCFLALQALTKPNLEPPTRVGRPGPRAVPARSVSPPACRLLPFSFL